MSFFIDNILFIAIFLTILSFVFLFLRKNNNKRIIQPLNHLSSEQIQIKLRAYERLILFLDRIEPTRMLNRLRLHNANIDVIESGLISNIIIEYEYNVSQQIYISDRLWDMIELVKNSTINNITEVASSLKKTAKADDFIAEILKCSKKNTLIIQNAKKLLKQEVKRIS